jgi:hypothetical protein
MDEHDDDLESEVEDDAAIELDEYPIIEDDGLIDDSEGLSQPGFGEDPSEL